MKIGSARLSLEARNLLAKLEDLGILRLNSTPRFPNVIDLGAGWPEIMELVSAHLCYVSRLVDGRTTYLSIPIYEACAALVPDRPPIQQLEAALFDLLDQGPMAVDEIAFLSHAGPAKVKKTLSRLQERFLVTVFGPGRNLNPNWDTYVWCTRRTWESHCPIKVRSLKIETARRRLEACLAPYLSSARLSRLIHKLAAGSID
ncbi:MAG: hypothetical protein GX493_03835 [Firmicutes bacterium]|nr:hypothetical protein [Bacillota bacterium]